MTTDDPPADERAVASETSEPDESAATGDGSDVPGLTDPPPTAGEHPGGPRREEPPFPAVASEVREHLAGESTGHDLAHVGRVFRLTQRLADEVEPEVDREVVGAAALVHDLHRVRGDDGGVDPEATLSEVEELLRTAGFPEAKVDDVLHCVAVHDDYGFRGDPDRTGSPEARVLQDADNLDATGTIGIARTFAFGGAHGTPLFDPDGETYSQLYHFEEKLLRLRDELNTEPARELAEDRHGFLERFRERFLREWHGEA